jgi:hypothetical protein
VREHHRWCSKDRTKEDTVGGSEETGQVTGTKDKNYDLIWFTEQCLSNVLRLETYIRDADRDGDEELVDLFKKAQADSKKGAQKGKALLGARLGD